MKKLFGTDGIRGIAGEFPLTRDIIYNLGRAISEKLSINKVLVGDDSRESSEWILKTLADGFASSNIEFDYTGTITTPALAKIVSLDKEYDGGIMISASHNPAEFNGIKILNSKGMKLSDNIEIELEKRIFELLENNGAPHLKGNIVRTDKKGFYIDFIRKNFQRCPKHLKIAIDCSNGGTSNLSETLFKELGYDVIMINCSPNGKNINKNCGSLYPEKVAKKVKEVKAFAGIAFDGDGDRVILVDEEGEILNGDILLYILADYYSKNGYKGAIVGTIMSNLSLEEKVKDMGLKFYRTPVGDKYVWGKMVETDSLIGGETSGHIILRDYHITGDGIIVALKVLEIAVKTGKKLSEYRNEIPLAHQIMENIPVKKKIPLDRLFSVKEMKEESEKLFGNNVRMIIRYSGTEPLLRVMIEGKDEGKIKDFVKTYSNKIKNEIEEVKE